MLQDAFETFVKTLVTQKSKLGLTSDKMYHNNGAIANRSDDNLNKRITKFHNYIKDENTYRAPLRFQVDIGMVNQPLKLDLKIKCTLETKIKKTI